jgi:hypothetical protein
MDINRKDLNGKLMEPANIHMAEKGIGVIAPTKIKYPPYFLI